jgi:hypothetical protein
MKVIRDAKPNTTQIKQTENMLFAILTRVDQSFICVI